MATFEYILDLCYNYDNLTTFNEDDLSEPDLVSRLKAAQIEPDVLSERDVYGRTLLHHAVMGGRSPEFCKVLHELDGTHVKTQDNHGWLPVHWACDSGRVDTAKYLLELYPSSKR